jgi:hypothetical protein
MSPGTIMMDMQTTTLSSIINSILEGKQRLTQSTSTESTNAGCEKIQGNGAKYFATTVNVKVMLLGTATKRVEERRGRHPDK